MIRNGCREMKKKREEKNKRSCAMASARQISLVGDYVSIDKKFWETRPDKSLRRIL